MSIRFIFWAIYTIFIIPTGFFLIIYFIRALWRDNWRVGCGMILFTALIFVIVASILMEHYPNIDSLLADILH